MNTLEYLKQAAKCVHLEDLWQMHAERMETYGFDRLIYGYTGYRSQDSLGDSDDFIILSNHDRKYLDHFLGDRMYYNAPMMRWALNNVGACSWGIVSEALRNGEMSEGERRAYQFNVSMDVTAGYTISFPQSSSRTKGAIALTARRGLTQNDVDEIWKQHGEDIEVINIMAHLKILTLPYTSPTRALTSRQREVLEWVGDGKTIQDIATILARTPATIEKHLRLARESLCVDTTAQALLKASFLNQIFRRDDVPDQSVGQNGNAS